MGKKRYKRQDVSQAMTKDLDMSDLYALKISCDSHYHTVHKSYFSKQKPPCPACGSSNTRCSKIVVRTFKDILYNKKDEEGLRPENFRVFDITFYQRYFRCNACNSSVFPEPINFAEKGCRYTNRLSDILADKTLHLPYKRVCAYFGVPASTASIGPIMRRRVQYRESSLLPIATPNLLSIAEIKFYHETYPVIFGVWHDEIYCMDILKDSSEESVLTFFRTLDASEVNTVFVDPVDSIRSATAAAFPNAKLVVTEECILRYARDAMLDIIRKDGKRFPLKHKGTALTILNKQIDSRSQQQIIDGMATRPRLKSAYDCHQQFMEIMSGDWSYETLTDWTHSIPTSLSEFDVLCDMIAFFEQEIHNSKEAKKPPDIYPTALHGVREAFNDMPHCIFEVLRARCFLTKSHDTLEENGTKRRLGILAGKLVQNMNEISTKIKERRDNDL